MNERENWKIIDKNTSNNQIGQFNNSKQIYLSKWANSWQFYIISPFFSFLLKFMHNKLFTNLSKKKTGTHSLILETLIFLLKLREKRIHNPIGLKITYIRKILDKLMSIKDYNLIKAQFES